MDGPVTGLSTGCMREIITATPLWKAHAVAVLLTDDDEKVLYFTQYECTCVQRFFLLQRAFRTGSDRDRRCWCSVPKSTPTVC